MRRYLLLLFTSCNYYGIERSLGSTPCLWMGMDVRRYSRTTKLFTVPAPLLPDLLEQQFKIRPCQDPKHQQPRANKPSRSILYKAHIVTLAFAYIPDLKSQPPSSPPRYHTITHHTSIQPSGLKLDTSRTSDDKEKSILTLTPNRKSKQLQKIEIVN